MLQYATPSTFSFRFEFLSQEDKTFRYIPPAIERFVIVQNGIDDYGDVIHVDVMCSIKDYTVFYEKYQNMYCIVLFVYCDQYGNRVKSVKPVKKKYRAILIDPKDLHKTVTDITHRIENEFRARFLLVEETLYENRATQINVLYKRATMQDVLHHVALAFNMKNVTVEAPSNKHVYDHVIIPPMHDFSSVFSYLQAEYGVYNAGLTHYFTNDNLYIYSPYNLFPKTKYELVVYQSVQYSLASVNSTCKVNPKNIEIVTDDVKHVTDHSIFGSENVGTSLAFLRSAEIQDGVIHYNKKLGPQFKKDVVLDISLNEPKLMTKETRRPHYATTTDNVFSLASRVLKDQCIRMTFIWPTSIPFLLRPGMKILYYWDNDGKLMKREGILESTATEFIPVSLTGTDNSTGAFNYKAGTQITARLMPNGVEVKNIDKTT